MFCVGLFATCPYCQNHIQFWISKIIAISHKISTFNFAIIAIIIIIIIIAVIIVIIIMIILWCQVFRNYSYQIHHIYMIIIVIIIVIYDHHYHHHYHHIWSSLSSLWFWEDLPVVPDFLSLVLSPAFLNHCNIIIIIIIIIPIIIIELHHPLSVIHH